MKKFSTFVSSSGQPKTASALASALSGIHPAQNMPLQQLPEADLLQKLMLTAAAALHIISRAV